MAADLSVAEMAQAMGVHRNNLAAWEHDRREPSLGTLRKWAEVTGVDLAWLLDLSGDTRGSSSVDGVTQRMPDRDPHYSQPELAPVTRTNVPTMLDHAA